MPRVALVNMVGVEILILGPFKRGSLSSCIESGRRLMQKFSNMLHLVAIKEQIPSVYVTFNPHSRPPSPSRWRDRPRRRNRSVDAEPCGPDGAPVGDV